MQAKKFKNGITDKQVEKFPWGRVLYVHQCGDISVVEYESYNEKSNKNSRLFHPYVAGEDIRHSLGSLEEAMITAYTYKYNGLNQDALVSGIVRALKIK